MLPTKIPFQRAVRRFIQNDFARVASQLTPEGRKIAEQSINTGVSVAQPASNMAAAAPQKVVTSLWNVPAPKVTAPVITAPAAAEPAEQSPVATRRFTQ